jgi:endo-1,4-beta-xylanase
MTSGMKATASEEKRTLEIEDFESLPPLRYVAERAGIHVGAAVSRDQLLQDNAFAAAVSRECNLIVPENSLKPKHLRPNPDNFDFEEADYLWRWAGNAQMRMRGHTLVWYKSIPDWLMDELKHCSKARAEQLLETHIHTVIKHFQPRSKDKSEQHILSWDVVNEAIKPEENNVYGLRQTPWLTAIGPSYIEKSFRYAAEADPSARLVYNDYYFGKDVIQLLQRLKDKGVPIHAVGIQSHVTKCDESILEPVKRLCRSAKEMELDVLITELDVFDGKDYSESDSFSKRDWRIAETTRIYLESIFSECTPTEILTWGLSDRYTWLENSKKFNPLGISARPLPLDRDLRRKPMWKEIYRALQSISA